MLLFPALTHEKIAVEFVKCHNVLCEGPSRNNAHVITLSGVRGNSEQVCFFSFQFMRCWNSYLSFIRVIITFRSTIHPSSKNPATKAAMI